MGIQQEIFAKLDQAWRIQGIRCDMNDLELRMANLERRVSFSLPIDSLDEDWDYEEPDNQQQRE